MITELEVNAARQLADQEEERNILKVKDYIEDLLRAYNVELITTNSEVSSRRSVLRLCFKSEDMTRELITISYIAKEITLNHRCTTIKEGRDLDIKRIKLIGFIIDNFNNIKNYLDTGLSFEAESDCRLIATKFREEQDEIRTAALVKQQKEDAEYMQSLKPRDAILINKYNYNWNDNTNAYERNNKIYEVMYDIEKITDKRIYLIQYRLLSDWSNGNATPEYRVSYGYVSKEDFIGIKKANKSTGRAYDVLLSLHNEKVLEYVNRAKDPKGFKDIEDMKGRAVLWN